MNSDRYEHPDNPFGRGHYADPHGVPEADPIVAPEGWDWRVVHDRPGQYSSTVASPGGLVAKGVHNTWREAIESVRRTLRKGWMA